MLDPVFYKKKVLGCFLGKAVGGTLGQPYEGCNGPLQLKFYNPVPTDMIPNDDLDLQVLWACVLAKMASPVVDREILADAWLRHVNFPWDEYGLALRNLRLGIRPPLCGSYDNWYVDGLGAAIRSEIWACLAPGAPRLAARYAYEDACVDHEGDGIYAEQFLAALESAAFTENSLARLLDIGLSVIPRKSRLAQMIADVRKLCKKSGDADWLRERILEKWGSENFTDCVMNLAFTVMALLLGRGDFGKTICLAANCGRDTDCTAATAGAILGLMNPDRIGEKWLKPIGRKLVLNAGIVGISHPDTLDGFVELLADLRERLSPAKPKAKKPVLKKLSIRAQTGIFAPWFALDENRFAPKLPKKTKQLKLSGTLLSFPARDIPADSLLLLRLTFNLKEAKTVRVLANSRSNLRCWLDGRYAFGREGGRMAPSFHRAPPNQFVDAELAKGRHELLLGLAPLGREKTVQVNFGIGDRNGFQWTAVDWD